MGLTANSLPEASLEDVGAGEFQLLFSSAENALGKDNGTIISKVQASGLKNNDTEVFGPKTNLAALVSSIVACV